MKDPLKKLIRKMSSWAWSEETSTLDGLSFLKELHATPDGMEIHLKQRPEAAAWVAQCFAELVAGSPNYTEMKFKTFNPRADYEWLTVTVQKGSGKTPHELRAEAEQELEELQNLPEIVG
jgi:hypothetical protein